MLPGSVSQALTGFALSEAQNAANQSNFFEALGWLEMVDASARPRVLTAAVFEGAAKKSAQEGDWPRHRQNLESALAVREDPLLRRRLIAAKVRAEMISKQRWESIAGKVDACSRLPPASLPFIKGVWACGAYYSRGRSRGAPWSKLLRDAKHAQPSTDEGQAVLNVACGYACWFIAENTPLLRYVDAVVAIPARPMRFVDRMMSLPDEMASAIQQQLTVPFLKWGLVSASGDLELRGLSHSERRDAIKESMTPGRLQELKGRIVLLVDDVITSGATLSEAARVLQQAGISSVY